MKSIWIRSLFFGGMLCVSTLYAFVYNANVLRLYNNDAHDYQYIVGVSDFHDKLHQANDTQRATLEQILNGCSKRDTLVVVEDLSSTNINGCRGCYQFVINSNKGI